MKKLISLIALLALGLLSAAALDLPEIFSDNMVLQQNTQVLVWGWAKPGSTIEISASWNKGSAKTTANKEGRWEMTLATASASYEPQQLSVKGDGDTRSLTNILIGEVWFCSGQSNMEMPLQGFWNCPIEGAREAVATSGRYQRAIRMVTIPKVAAQQPQDRVSGKWQLCEPQNAGLFSAVGFFFARTLTELLDVPVGIINCSWGGSCVEGWLPREILETYPDKLVPYGDNEYMQKMVMYNGMLHPLAGYTIKGFLWNQGESNINHEDTYQERFTTMVNLWRKLWKNDRLPIYTVELPPYWYDDAEGTNGADLRAVQHKIAHELPYSGCVSTTDLIYPHETKQIHGTRKLEIGQRLAYMAAARDYGMPGVAAEAPEIRSAKVVEMDPNQLSIIAGTPVEKNPNARGRVVQLWFSHGTDGFDRLSDIEGFEAAGADGVWHKAIVWADSNWQGEADRGCYLNLVCPEAGAVQAVRYNYHNFTTTSLHNNWGLPVVPFCFTLDNK